MKLKPFTNFAPKLASFMLLGIFTMWLLHDATFAMKAVAFAVIVATSLTVAYFKNMGNLQFNSFTGRVQKLTSAIILGFSSLMLFSEAAFAAMPWETGINFFASSICGPTAKGVAIVAICATGFAIAFLETKGWLHALLIVILGCSIAVFAPTMLSSMGIFTSISCN